MKLSSMGYLLKEGLKNIWNNRTMSIASICVLVSCLVLTGAALLFSQNVNSIMGDVQDRNTVEVYLDMDIPTLEAVRIGPEIQKIDNVESCEFIRGDDQLEQYRDVLGDLVDGLQGDERVLPDSYRITMTDLSLYQQTVDQILQVEGVDTISDRSQTAEKLTSLNRLVSTIGFWVVLALAIVSLFIIVNTIRVTMYSRRLEISIMKSVGATDWFIRIPFIVEGIIIGLISALIATLLLDLLYDA